jgi:hypothetical protein
MVRPSAFAAFRLMTSSNFLGRTIGRSFGLEPLRIRPVYGPDQERADALLGEEFTFVACVHNMDGLVAPQHPGGPLLQA